MNSNTTGIKYHIIIHLIVLIWGVTGILGDHIQLSSIHAGFFSSRLGISTKIVFFRTLIAFVSLMVIGFFYRAKSIHLKDKLKLTAIGFLVGLHWLMFFYAIKISTVSIGVVCMSLTTLFTSFLEPIVFKRKMAVSELIISLVIVIGIITIFGFEFRYKEGILVGLLSAFLAALFSVINGKITHQFSSILLTKYEMLGAVIVTFLILTFHHEVDSNLFNSVQNRDWYYLIFLGLVCTSLAFIVSVWVMRHLSPFTISLSINMEPIYTIIMAVLLNPYKEVMSVGFYLGGAIIISAIVLNAYLKSKKNKKNMVLS